MSKTRKNTVYTDKPSASMESFDQDFMDRCEIIMDTYDNGKSSAPCALRNFISEISLYLEGRRYNYDTPCFNTHLLIKMTDEALGKRCQKAAQHYDYGCIVEGLIQFGCPKNQAYDAVAKWLSIQSITTLETSRKKYLGLLEGDDLSADSLVFLEHHNILKFIGNIDKDFPNCFRKASPAFNDLIDACKKETKRKQDLGKPILLAKRPY